MVLEVEQKDNKQWAFLCKEHYDMITQAISDGDAKKTLSYWIKAGGGASKMAARV